MNIKEFTELYAQKRQITKEEAGKCIEAFKELLSECFDKMESGERLSFYRFGTFAKKTKPAHIIGDIKTGKRVEIPAKDRIVFTRSKIEKANTEDN